jgi:fatty acid desaturase
LLVPVLPIRVIALLASCLGFTGIATLGHVASHNAGLGSPRANRILYYISFPLLLQVSTSYWRYSHLTVHHPSPNVIDVDNDCDLRPVFATNQTHLSQFAAWRQRWPLLQALLLLSALPLNGLNIIRQGWVRLFLVLRESRGRRLAPWLDLACMVLHLGLFLALPMLFFRPLDVVLFYALRLALIGCGMFAVLAPGHYPAEAACLSSTQRTAGDFYLRQAATTVNFRTGFIGHFLCSGLEYQIEHHFFPSATCTSARCSPWSKLGAKSRASRIVASAGERRSGRAGFRSSYRKRSCRTSKRCANQRPCADGKQRPLRREVRVFCAAARRARSAHWARCRAAL